MIEEMFTRYGGADALEEGFWLIQRRRAERVDIPVKVAWQPPADPDTGEILDRSPRWHVYIAGMLFTGEPIRVGNVPIGELLDFWPACRTDPIDRAEYEFRIQRQAWAAVYDPNDPFGTPGGKIDPMSATLPFMD